MSYVQACLFFLLPDMQCCGYCSPLLRLHSHHVSSRAATSGLHVLPGSQWLALPVPGAGLEDCSAPKAALQVVGQGCRARRAGRRDHRSGKPADAEPRHRHRPRWRIPNVDFRTVRETEKLLDSPSLRHIPFQPCPDASSQGQSNRIKRIK